MMPGWRVHRYVDIVFFGKSYSKIHRKMDAPVFFLGRRHRVLFHDPASAAMIAQECYPGDPAAVEAAYLHILTDENCSADPNYKKYLTSLAVLNGGKKRSKKKVDPLFKTIKNDAKKLEELWRLFRIFCFGLR